MGDFDVEEGFKILSRGVRRIARIGVRSTRKVLRRKRKVKDV